MDNSNTEFSSPITSGTSIDELLRQTVQDTINKMMKHELTVFLDYEKYDPIGYNSGNSRNGYNPEREIQTRFGPIKVQIPRDRLGEFRNQLFRPYQTRSDRLEDTIILLYQKGITTRQIAEMIEGMYGYHYSAQQISKLTQLTQESVNAWHSRTLNRRYVILFCDATYLNVRRDTVAKEALHVVVGIDDKGYKEVLDYRLYPQESAENYREMLEDIKARGAQEVLLVASDGLSGFAEMIGEVYPRAKYQRCWVHVMRNVNQSVRNKDRKEISEMIKAIYQAGSEEKAREILEEVCKCLHPRYPKVEKLLRENQYLFSFYQFPKEIRRSIYTTNIVEGLNKNLKRYTKRKEQFPNEESLDRFVCQIMSQYNNKEGERMHRGFDQARTDLEEIFENFYPG
jgi:transposase-like protein